MFEREQYWISYYNAVEDPNFYNLSRGGEGKEKLLEVRLKMSNSHKGKKRGPHSEITKERMSKSNKGKKSTHLQCLETGQIFINAMEAANFYNMKSSNKALVAARVTINNVNQTFNNLHWIIIEDLTSPYNEEERNNILLSLPPKANRKGYKNKETSKTHFKEYLEKPVQCLEDLKTFKSVKEAANFYNINFQTIAASARDIDKGFYHKDFKLNFIYLKNNTSYNASQLENILKSLKPIGTLKKVQSLEAGLVFDSAAAAGRFYHVKGTLISDCARDVTKGIDCTSVGQHWIYLLENIIYNEKERLSLLNSLVKRREFKNGRS